MVNFRPRARVVWAGRGGAEGSELRFSAGRVGGRAHLRLRRGPRGAVTSQPGGTVAASGSCGPGTEGTEGLLLRGNVLGPRAGAPRGGEGLPGPTRSSQRSLPRPPAPRLAFSRSPAPESLEPPVSSRVGHREVQTPDPQCGLCFAATARPQVDHCSSDPRFLEVAPQLSHLLVLPSQLPARNAYTDAVRGQRRSYFRGCSFKF